MNASEIGEPFGPLTTFGAWVGDGAFGALPPLGTAVIVPLRPIPPEGMV